MNSEQLWRKATSHFLASFNTESSALEIVKPGREDICSSRGIIFPTHNKKKKKKKRLESFPDSLFISDLLFRVWPDKHLVNGGH